MASLQLPLWRSKPTWRPPAQLPSLAGAKRICLDVETRDESLAKELGPGVRRGGYIVGLGVGVENGPRCYLPIRHEGGGNLDPGLVMEWARDELNAYEGEVVGANVLYDLDYLAEEGVTLPKVKAFHDVQIAEAIIDEHKRGQYNLDALSQVHLGEGKAHGHLEKLAVEFGWRTETQIKQNLWRLSGADVGEYGEGDVDRPLRILAKQLKLLEADEQLHCYTMERELIPLLLAMRRRGVRVNLNRADQVDAILKRELAKWSAEVRRLAGASADFNSAESLAPALRERGLELNMTAGGKNSKPKPQVDKFFLERNQGDHLVDAIAASRRLFTLKNTFIDGVIRSHTIKGRIHPTFRQTKSDDGGTVGVRFSSAGPNLQFIPSRESEWDDQMDLGDYKADNIIRSCFEADEGDCWGQDDYSQIEYRLLVHFAVGQGAEAARQKYRDDPKTDFHKLCAEMLGVDPEDKVRRKRVKNTNFAKGYGAQANKLAETFNCSVEEAQAFVDEYDRALPFSKATLEAAARWAQRRGFVVTVDGRKQRFPFWCSARWEAPAWMRRPNRGYRIDEAREKFGRRLDDGTWVPDPLKRWKDYVALNRKLQSSAGELMKLSMLKAWKSGVCAVLGPFLATIHDELGSSIPMTKAGHEAHRELVHIMETIVPLKVPVLVGSARGPNWGACVEQDDAKIDQAERDRWWKFAA